MIKILCQQRCLAVTLFVFLHVVFTCSLNRNFPILHHDRFKSSSRLLSAEESQYIESLDDQRNPAVARSIIGFIESRYGRSVSWQRTKMYVYRSKKLSLASVGRVLDYLDSFLHQETVVKLLTESPRILNKSVDSYLKPTAGFLLDLWGEELFELAMIRNPQLLLTSGVGYNPPENEDGETDGIETVESVLSDKLELTSNAINKLKRESPFVFGLSPKKVDSVLVYLGSLLQPIDKPDQKLRKLVLSHPNVLNLSVETNIRPRIDFLVKELDLTSIELAKIIQTGAVLGLSVDKNLRPTLGYLQHDLSLESDLKKCVLSHPQLLALSLENLKTKRNYFKTIGPTLAPRIARKCPAVFSLSLSKNVIPTIDFLARVWGCPVNDSQMEAYLSEYPNVLTLSVPGNMQPTMNFFNRTGYTCLDENWILTNGASRIRGRYVASSLFQRLLPRWHYCAKLEVPAPPLHLLANANDAIFCNTLGLDLEEFLLFRQEAIPRLKFSSQFDTWLKTGRPIDTA